MLAYRATTEVCLELLRQADVVVAIADRVERGVVVVVERTQHGRRVTVEDVVAPHGDLRVPQHPLPEGAAVHTGHVLAHRALRVLAILRVATASRSRLRLDEGVAQLQVERLIRGHTMMQDERWV